MLGLSGFETAAATNDFCQNAITTARRVAVRRWSASSRQMKRLHSLMRDAAPVLISCHH